VLDEATSALDLANEIRIYEELANAATTLISVSHHTTLLKFHKQVLELAGNGEWQLRSATGYTG
jgi:putative ATP-binding cassette transporter